MNMKLTLPALLAFLALAALPAASFGQAKIALANPARIIDGIKETKDLQAKLKADIASLEQQSQQKQNELNDLKGRRDQLNPGTPQYDQLNGQFRNKAIDLQAWSQINKADLESRQKGQLKSLYKKMQEAVAEVAKTAGYDLVLTEQAPTIPDNTDQMQMNELRGLLSSRNVLFANPSIDITSQVIAKMDEKYQSGK